MASANQTVISSAVMRCLNNYSNSAFQGPVTGFTYYAPLDAIITMHKSDAINIRILEDNDELFPTV